ncbi:uncharacterized protein LOC142635535 [Castanea sativa]|uniref:uncharacterized protein LOC142635535 n=1 Tax=Castanea sativa TaxID=21020 RepID=UPI003F653308
MAQIDTPIIVFSKEDARRLHHPHDDALIVSIQMRIKRERLVPTNTPLVGFGGTRVYPLGVVTLPVIVGDYLQQITKDVTFLIVDWLSAYNAILGRPTLNLWKTVTSTYHLMIKFPTKY